MPIGIPKVLWKLPGDEEGSLIDLSNALYLSRSFVLFKDIDDNIVNEVASMILYWNQDNPLKELFLFINSRGGSIRAAMGMYNLITELSADVNTVALGKCGSSASLILVGGTLNKLPHARILLHEPEIEKEDSSQNEELIRDAGEREDRHKMILDIYVERSGNAILSILQDLRLRKPVYLSAEEAKSYGIVDSIANKELLERMRKGMGMGEDENDEDERKVGREQSE